MIGPMVYTSSARRVLLILAVQRQHCIEFRVLRAQDFYTVLALKHTVRFGRLLASLEVLGGVGERGRGEGFCEGKEHH